MRSLFLPKVSPPAAARFRNGATKRMPAFGRCEAAQISLLDLPRLNSADFSISVTFMSVTGYEDGRKDGLPISPPPVGATKVSRARNVVAFEDVQPGNL